MREMADCSDFFCSTGTYVPYSRRLLTVYKTEESGSKDAQRTAQQAATSPFMARGSSDEQTGPVSVKIEVKVRCYVHSRTGLHIYETRQSTDSLASGGPTIVDSAQ